MGGKHYKDERCPRASYLAMEKRIKSIAHQLFEDGFRIPLHHHDKQDYGDMDILVRSDLVNEQVIQQFSELTKASDHGRNGPTRTFRVPLTEEERSLSSSSPSHLQVDLFPTGTEHGLQSHFEFMSWGDLGNILGRLLRSWGLMWGEEGLEYVFRRGESFKRMIPVGGINEALQLAGLDPETWKRGFSNEQEMFDWLMTASEFCADQYLDPNGASRKRAAERAGMMRFIKRVQALHPQRASDHIYQRPPRHDLQELLQALPSQAKLQLATGISHWETHYQKVVDASERFSGNTVLKLRPELCGKGLGSYLRRFKLEICLASASDKETMSEALYQWIDGLTQQEIDQAICDFPPSEQEIQDSRQNREYLSSGEGERRAGKKAAAQARKQATEAGTDDRESQSRAESARQNAMRELKEKNHVQT